MIAPSEIPNTQSSFCGFRQHRSANYYPVWARAICGGHSYRCTRRPTFKGTPQKNCRTCIFLIDTDAVSAYSRAEQVTYPKALLRHGELLLTYSQHAETEAGCGDKDKFHPNAEREHIYSSNQLAETGTRENCKGTYVPIEVPLG